MTATQGVKLDEATRQRLKALGQLRKRTTHWLMRTAIERYLVVEEAYEREKLEDLERWEQYRMTGKTISQPAVTHWLANLAQGKVTPCPE